MQLLNECLRTIYNTIELCTIQRDTFINQLVRFLDEVTFGECQAFMNRVRETRQKHLVMQES